MDFSLLSHDDALVRALAHQVLACYTVIGALVTAVAVTWWRSEQKTQKFIEVLMMLRVLLDRTGRDGS